MADDGSLQFVVTLRPNGEVIFPADLRERLGLKPHDRIMFVRKDENSLWVLETDADRRARIRALIGHLRPTDGTLVSEELIADRRREAERENSED
jgi:AbrB family looped-hinge helix DNA binding protein